MTRSDRDRVCSFGKGENEFEREREKESEWKGENKKKIELRALRMGTCNSLTHAFKSIRPPQWVSIDKTLVTFAHKAGDRLVVI